MAALVLTALSISPVFKDMDQSKLKYRNPVTKINRFIVCSPDRIPRTSWLFAFKHSEEFS